MPRPRIKYVKRIIFTYIFNRKRGHLSFWYAPLSLNNFNPKKIGPYYINFENQAKYSRLFDKQGIPMLNYGGDIGIQYSPDAIAQYGLGCLDLFRKTGQNKYKEKAIKQADWLVKNIRMIDKDLGLWEYKFDFEARKKLSAPWHSALIQGSAISLLVRIYTLAKKHIYLQVAQKAYEVFKRSPEKSGVVVEEDGYTWLEEIIIDPPNHILNGFILALWGVYDYFLATKDKSARDLFNKCIKTIKNNLHRYDLGFWTTYDLAKNGPENPASSCYHQLHILLLEGTYLITGEEIFKKYAERWKKYFENKLYRLIAFIWKAYFKIIYF